MGKKKKPRSNNNNKKKKKGNKNHASSTNTQPNGMGRNASKGNARPDPNIKLLDPPLEPGRFAVVSNLVGRSDLNGTCVTIQKILSNGRVVVESVYLPGTDLEEKEIVSVKAANLVALWKFIGDFDTVGKKECPICMDTNICDRTTPKCSSCGKSICNSCLVAMLRTCQHRCPLCNFEETTLSDDALLEKLRSKAEGGDHRAMDALGGNYGYGNNGTMKDEAIARMWYQKAAVLGNVESSYSLAICNMYGNGGPVDYVEAVRWFAVASNLGNANSTAILGGIYLYGIGGIPQDLDKAKMLLQKGVDVGHEGAIHHSKELHRLLSLKSDQNSR